MFLAALLKLLNSRKGKRQEALDDFVATKKKKKDFRLNDRLKMFEEPIDIKNPEIKK